MDTIRVNKAEVIERLRANRNQHENTYAEAMAGWRSQSSAKLRELAAELDAGGSPSLYIKLERPEDHTEEYDIVLGMLDLSVEDEIEMTLANYRNYILDMWHWSEKFRTTASAYSIQH